MKKIIQIKSIALTLLTFFLFTSTFNFYLSTNELSKESHKLILAKKASSTKSNDFQVPFEEKEAEDGEDDDSDRKDNSVKQFFFHALIEFTSTNPSNFEPLNISLFNTQRIKSQATETPLFISNRAILI